MKRKSVVRSMPVLPAGKIAEKSADGLFMGFSKQEFIHKDMQDFVQIFELHIMNPLLICGLFLGGMMALLFCAMTMKAVGRAAGHMVEEVRRQFKEKPGIMEGKDKPDYARCVAISTAGAQREMLIPSLMAIFIPVLTGLVLGVPGVMGLMVGGLVCGVLLATMLNNAGGAWDNAKKYIEKGAHGGKGSPAHKASVIGDTVGDPCKDTSGPSLNILIKLMAMVSVVFAPLVVQYAPIVQRKIGILPAVVAPTNPNSPSDPKPATGSAEPSTPSDQSNNCDLDPSIVVVYRESNPQGRDSQRSKTFA